MGEGRDRAFRAYAALLGAQFRSAASYRGSFAVELVTNLGATAMDVLTVIVLFRPAPQVGGFSLAQALLMVSLASCAFVVADIGVGNIDRLQGYVRAGTLDAVLIRPLGVLAQLMLMDLPLRKALRLVLALVVLGIALHANPIVWTPARLALLVLAPLFGAVFFGAIFVLSAALAFWWVDSGEIGSAFTYGGRDFASYPVTMFEGWFRALFAYGLGFAFVAYQPALAILGIADPLGLPPWAGYASPLVALIAAGVAALAWRAGIRQYRSTGS
ncbi:ABC transporter permease [Krasilnikovia sp. M28-CT-15]|uniref:ABC transporter permease n=1 Tax=Krasilnikovia sp. M28-CT-15 TaxID=3373540 RepID=UPI0038762E55